MTLAISVKLLVGVLLLNGAAAFRVGETYKVTNPAGLGAHLAQKLSTETVLTITKLLKDQDRVMVTFSGGGSTNLTQAQLKQCCELAIPAAPAATTPTKRSRSRAVTAPAWVRVHEFVRAPPASTRSSRRGSATFKVGDKARVINAVGTKHVDLYDKVTVTGGADKKGKVFVQKGEGRPFKIAASCLRLATSQGSPRQKKSSKASSTSSSKANNLVWEGMQVWKNDKKSNLRTIKFNEAKTAFAVYGGSLFMSGKNRKNITLTNIDTLKMDGDKVIIFRKGGKAVKPCVITGPNARQFAEFLRGLLDADQIEHASFQITEATMFGRRRLVERLQGF